MVRHVQRGGVVPEFQQIALIELVAQAPGQKPTEYEVGGCGQQPDHVLHLAVRIDHVGYQLPDVGVRVHMPLNGPEGELAESDVGINHEVVLRSGIQSATNGYVVGRAVAEIFPRVDIFGRGKAFDRAFNPPVWGIVDHVYFVHRVDAQGCHALGQLPWVRLISDY